MIKNYLKIAYRNFLRNKAFTSINISGLMIGMTCCILIFLFVQDELSYDRFHENSHRIYRVTRRWFNDDGVVNLHLGHVAPPFAPLLANDFPEIIHSVRLHRIGGPIVSFEEKQFVVNRFFFADKDIFKVFTLDMIRGNSETALQNPFTIVITQEIAKKFFGEDEAIGKVLKFSVSGIKVDLKVTGVIKALPQNSHFHCDILGSFKTYERFAGKREMENWGSNNYATYILLPENYNINKLISRLDSFVEKHMYEDASRDTQLVLQRLTDIHLRSHLDSEIEPNSDIAYVYIFSAIALFILLIACINFMNLATARSAGRAKEVGMRKVVGAHKTQLIRQFLFESGFMSIMALILAIILVIVILPQFNKFINRELPFNISDNILLLSGLFGIALFVGLVSGSYPAFFLSAFQPVKVLKGTFRKGAGSSYFRTILVTAQFAISIILIISVGIVSDQLNYMRNVKLGFDQEHILVLPSSPRIKQQLESVKNILKQHMNIINVSAAKRVPSGRLLDSSDARVTSGETSQPVSFRIANILVDHDYIPTYGIELAAGRNFSKEMPTDADQAFILNETAVRRIGWKSPEEAIDKKFGYGRRQGKIIGVVKDFHFESMHQEISPMVLYITSSQLNLISIRIRPDNIPETLSFLQNKWNEYRPGYPFSYYFINERFDRLYKSEEKLQQIFSTFAFLGIFIACLGLFGLASYTAENRTKEIGIRKTLGASAVNIMMLLTKEFTKLVLIANIVAWPVAFFAMNRWLQDFAYRIDMSIITYILAGFIAAGVAVITVSTHAVKASLVNPVKSLRYE